MLGIQYLVELVCLIFLDICKIYIYIYKNIYVYTIKDWIRICHQLLAYYKFIPGGGGGGGKDLHAAIILEQTLPFRFLAPHYVEYLHTTVFLIWKLYM